MLKTDSNRARIVSCAVSDGETTISYPWHGKAITATKELLLSPVPKIMHNGKFELRWTMKEFGHGINNMRWDSMIAAHTLDNRMGINGLDFQAFVLLGQPEWDSHISPFFKSSSPNVENKIKHVPLPSLLPYGGMDALLEWKIAHIQAKQMGEEL